MNISVVITTYQRPKLVKRAIESVVNQTYQINEIIVIEDASDSGIETWIKYNYPNVRYIRNKNNFGLAGSRNVGIRESKWGWIAFLDDDDEWLEQRLEFQVKALRNQIDITEIHVSQVGVEFIGINGKVKHIQLPLNVGNLKESIIEKGLSTPSSSFLFRKEALLSIGGFDEDLVSSVDHDIWMKMAVAGYNTLTVEKPLVRVYEECNDTMMTDTEKRIKGVGQFLEKWLPTFKEWFGDEKSNEYIKDYYSTVVGRLAIAKLYGGYISDFIISVKSIYRVCNLNPSIWITFISMLIKAFLLNVYKRFE